MLSRAAKGSLRSRLVSPTMAPSAQLGPAAEWAASLDMAVAPMLSHWPPAVERPYDWKASSSDNYWSGEQEGEASFTGEFAGARGKLDYSYHRNPVHSRQVLQDTIIKRVMSSQNDESPAAASDKRRPWIVFTAGAMGVGKSYAMTTLYTQGLFPLGMFIKIDPDLIKAELPELRGYKSHDPPSAATNVHRESTQITDVLFEDGLMSGSDLLVDGSLRDLDWYSLLMDRLRRDFPQYRIGILHIHAQRETILRRAERRGEASGRVVPRELLEDSIRQVPASVAALASKVDTVVTILNEDGKELELEGDTCTWEAFCALWPNSGRCRTLSDKDLALYKSLSTDKRTSDTGGTYSLAALKAAQKLYRKAFPSTCTRCFVKGTHELGCPCCCVQESPDWKVQLHQAMEKAVMPVMYRLGMYDTTPKNWHH